MYKRWLESPVVDGQTKAELRSIAGDEEEIKARFSVPLEFGTAGLRSVMSAGTSRMNVYTVAHTTAGLAKLIIKEGGEKRGAAVAHDCRINSEKFAKAACEVLAANGIRVYFFESLRPTPELSFAIPYLNCIAGINITASHNTKEYNGYKVYWEDGAQLPPDHAAAVSAAVAETDIFDDVRRLPFDEAVGAGLVTIIGSEVDEAYMKAVLNCRVRPEASERYGDGLKLIYTPLHGTGHRLVPEVLKRAGFGNVRVVPSQSVPDGNFPTVKSPNPENSECFNDAINLALSSGGECELILASDPDGDRLGTAVKDASGLFTQLSGNQVGCLLLDYIIKGRKEKGTMPERPCAIKSIVSSSLYEAICAANGVTCISVLTGFKFIGGKITELGKTGEYNCIFGYEESYGYLPGVYARDKDAVAAALLVSEMAAFFRGQGRTLCSVLSEIYERYGYYKELQISRVVEGIDPMRTMGEKMAALRQDAFKEIAGAKVTRVRDYKAGEITSLVDYGVVPTGLPKSDVLYYELADGSSYIIRPSGTEPKIKVYVLTKGKNAADADKKLAEFSEFTETLI